MNKHFKKTGYPYVLLASLPLLVLGACASPDKSTTVEDAVSPATEIKKPIDAVQDPIAIQQAHTSEFDTEDTKQVSSEEKTILPAISSPEETALYPPAIEPQEKLIGFGFDQAEVDAQFHELLKQHAQYLSENQDLQLRVSGHTDSFGPKDYNRYLSKQRAEAVSKLLVEYGAPADRIIVEGNADEDPLLSAAHQREHRRVELDYQDQRLVIAE